MLVLVYMNTRTSVMKPLSIRRAVGCDNPPGRLVALPPTPPNTHSHAHTLIICPCHLLVKLNMTISWALGHIPHHLSERESPRGRLRDAGALCPPTTIHRPSSLPKLSFQHCPCLTPLSVCSFILCLLAFQLSHCYL